MWLERDIDVYMSGKMRCIDSTVDALLCFLQDWPIVEHLIMNILIYILPRASQLPDKLMENHLSRKPYTFEPSQANPSCRSP